MSLFRRNKGARQEGDEAAAAEPGLPGAEPATEGAPTAEQPQPAVAQPVEGQREPAELDALVGEPPSSRRRGRLRRRLRHLRRVREVLLRDLGGLTFELHRSGSGEGGPVVEGKLARLSDVDREIRALEDHLSDHRAMILREPGIGGTCQHCGEIFGSEARYCWACGNPVAIGSGGTPHLAAWSTHPQLTAATAPESQPLPSAATEATWEEHPTAPLPQMDPQEVGDDAEPAAANEPATGDVGPDTGAMWSGDEPPGETEPPSEAGEPPAPGASEAWLPREEGGAPDVSSGDPLRPHQP